MKPYSPTTNKGRTAAGEDVHHRTADQPRKAANAAAKPLKRAARQQGRQQATGRGRDMDGLDDTFYPIPGFSSAGEY